MQSARSFLNSIVIGSILQQQQKQQQKELEQEQLDKKEKENEKKRLEMQAAATEEQPLMRKTKEVGAFTSSV